MIHSFCLETNRYTNQNVVAGFQDVKKEEMMAFVAKNIVMGIQNTSDVKYFWSTDPILSQSWFSSMMSRDRFLQIFYYLHLNNNQNDPGNDKMNKVRPLLDHIVRQCKKHYKRCARCKHPRGALRQTTCSTDRTFANDVHDGVYPETLRGTPGEERIP